MRDRRNAAQLSYVAVVHTHDRRDSLKMGIGAIC